MDTIAELAKRIATMPDADVAQALRTAVQVARTSDELATVLAGALDAMAEAGHSA